MKTVTKLIKIQKNVKNVVIICMNLLKMMIVIKPMFAAIIIWLNILDLIIGIVLQEQLYQIVFIIIFNQELHVENVLKDII